MMYLVVSTSPLSRVTVRPPERATAPSNGTRCAVDGPLVSRAAVTGPLQIGGGGAARLIDHTCHRCRA